MHNRFAYLGTAHGVASSASAFELLVRHWPTLRGELGFATLFQDRAYIPGNASTNSITSRNASSSQSSA
jgi:hypothetical protein